MTTLVRGDGNRIRVFLDCRTNDVENATVPGQISTNVTVVFGVCNFSGAGNGTLLQSYDADAMTASGTYTTNIACFANCFDCGGQGAERTYEGSFDVNFVPRPFCVEMFLQTL